MRENLQVYVSSTFNDLLRRDIPLLKPMIRFSLTSLSAKLLKELPPSAPCFNSSGVRIVIFCPVYPLECSEQNEIHYEGRTFVSLASICQSSRHNTPWASS